MDQSLDTIVAISTPPGRGGIGVVRLSGPAALPIATKLVRLNAPLDHGRARLGSVLDATVRGSGAAGGIDQAVVTAFLAPRSYTGDDLVEISAHGSPPILQLILDHALTWGARLARPGEFTERAFLSGRLDLTQAEAVRDLISAQTLEQARSAAQQMSGVLSRRLKPVKEKLVELIAVLEAGMDFASGELDDVDTVSSAQIGLSLASLRNELEPITTGFRSAQLLRQGAKVALVGLTNAGKSSLFNALLGRDRAIVTPDAGTTRDTVEEVFPLAGIPIHLIDTAGLREDRDAASTASILPGQRAATQLDAAERLGIARSREAIADADLVLLIHDATQGLALEEELVAQSLACRPHLLVWSKTDLLLAPPSHADAGGVWTGAIHVSAQSGEGLAGLRQAMLQRLGWDGEAAASGCLNNLRQYEALTEAVAAVDTAARANRADLPHELMLLDLHGALAALDRLTGATTADDILARIFSSFCIGK